MQPSPTRVTSIEQLYASASAMAAPVIIHVDGVVDWGNRSFVERFRVADDALLTMRIRELLWCIGVPDAITGMIAEGLSFQNCTIPANDALDSMLVLKQICLTVQPDGRKHMMLILRDEFDDDDEEIQIGDH